MKGKFESDFIYAYQLFQAFQGSRVGVGYGSNEFYLHPPPPPWADGDGERHARRAEEVLDHPQAEVRGAEELHRRLIRHGGGAAGQRSSHSHTHTRAGALYDESFFAPLGLIEALPDEGLSAR